MKSNLLFFICTFLHPKKSLPYPKVMKIFFYVFHCKFHSFSCYIQVCSCGWCEVRINEGSFSYTDVWLFLLLFFFSWKRLFSSHWMNYLSIFGQKSIDHIYMDLLLDSVLFHWFINTYLYANTIIMSRLL